MDQTSVIQSLDKIVGAVGNIVWGPLMLTLLVGTGLLLTFRLQLLQFWQLPYALKQAFSIKNRSDVLARAYIGEWKNQKGVCRKYTPRECLRLMGFKDDFKIIHKDDVMYRQSGNSIVVNVLMELIKEIQKTGVWDND